MYDPTMLLDLDIEDRLRRIPNDHREPALCTRCWGAFLKRKNDIQNTK